MLQSNSIHIFICNEFRKEFGIKKKFEENALFECVKVRERECV